MTSRRRFIHIVPVAALWWTAEASSQQAPVLDEKDPQAAALGYVADATRADKAKFPKYAPGQVCGNCQLFQADGKGPDGPCSLFAGKRVATKGWCSAWVKKAG